MVTLKPADETKEAADLTAMEERNYETDRLDDDWASRTTLWIMKDGQKAGLIAFLPNMTPGESFKEDWESPGTMWLIDICVLPEFREKGIGKLAMQEAIDWVRKQGTFGWLISNFRSSNEASRRLHDACGFQFIDVIPGYYADPTEDAELVQITFADLPAAVA